MEPDPFNSLTISAVAATMPFALAVATTVPCDYVFLPPIAWVGIHWLIRRKPNYPIDLKPDHLIAIFGSVASWLCCYLLYQVCIYRMFLDATKG